MREGTEEHHGSPSVSGHAKTICTAHVRHASALGFLCEDTSSTTSPLSFSHCHHL